jgi:hypothetical protein
MRMSDWQMLLSIVATIYFRNRRSSRRIGYTKTFFSSRRRCIILAELAMLLGIDSYQLSNRTCVPKA